MIRRFLILCSVVLLVGCSKDEVFISVQEQLKRDIVIIDQYMDDNSIVAQKHVSGIRYVIDKKGTGQRPDKTSKVFVNYEGKLMSTGKVFDKTRDKDKKDGAEFFLSNVISGWQIGIPLFKEGGSGTLYIPSGYAYGRQKRGSIPADAILIFTINLLKVK